MHPSRFLVSVITLLVIITVYKILVCTSSNYYSEMPISPISQRLFNSHVNDYLRIEVKSACDMYIRTISVLFS